jgi:two-component system cell cycle response regulator
VISGWLVLPLVLFAIAAAVMAVTAQRERADLAEAGERERALLTRVEDLETALAAIPKEAAAPPAPEANADGGDDEEPPISLTDPLTGLFNEAFFRVTLDTRVSAARRHLRPVAVVLMQVAKGVREGSASPVSPMVVADGVRTTLRDADTACRLEDGRFALILEDTPENGAVWTVERVRRALAVEHPGQTLWAGIACYPAHAFDAWELFDRAGQALDAAQEWHQDRIEVATSE